MSTKQDIQEFIDQLIKTPKSEIFRTKLHLSYPDQIHNEVLKHAINIKCAEDLESSINSLIKSIDKNSESNLKVSTKLLWLNIILTIITCIGIVIAFIKLYCKIP